MENGKSVLSAAWAELVSCASEVEIPEEEEGEEKGEGKEEKAEGEKKQG